MRSWVVRRLLLGAGQTLAVVLLVFALTEALPGDAAVALAGDQPDPARIAA
ncbi:peptide ABC transporter permease, partial [Streptomyces sp. Ru73]